MQFSYVKMQGAGNQIVVVDQRDENTPPPNPEQLRIAGNDATGPGFDQLMWVTRATSPGSAAAYRVFNNDGSEVEQCGNGVRCVARILAADAGREFTLDSPAGPVDVRVPGDAEISVSMGTSRFESSQLEVQGQVHDVSLVSMGNPHCVLQVDDVATAEVASLGPAIESHERFPERINVGFMEVVDRNTIRLRVFERGVGETRACGTGACAAAVAGQSRGLLDEGVRVYLPGGQLVVSWRGDADTVWLTGDAEILSEGIIDL
jgi:diaminopimelate epimerase